jgi:hypothetical protein
MLLAHVSKCFKEFYSKKKERPNPYCNYIEKRQRELRGSLYEVADRAMILVLTTSIGEEWGAFISVTRGSLRDKEGENAPLYANWKRRIVEEEVNKYKRQLTMNENSKNRGAMRLNQKKEDTREQCSNCGKNGHEISSCWSGGGGAVNEVPWNQAGYKPKFQKREANRSQKKRSVLMIHTIGQKIGLSTVKDEVWTVHSGGIRSLRNWRHR